MGYCTTLAPRFQQEKEEDVSNRFVWLSQLSYSDQLISPNASRKAFRKVVHKYSERKTCCLIAQKVERKEVKRCSPIKVYA
ncbi:hypothetical protein [Priestia koreensis]|uniref:hypothetical protein n=1 Tax=Priestia koreensis TaxID=284581 RepID=UPI0012EE5670|nr:hypothetical protein [Priestia koreensis]